MTGTFVAIPAIALALSGCTSIGQIPATTLASGTLRSASGSPAGTVALIAAGDQVTVNIAVIGLPRGTHGLHLHMIGRCDAPGFTSAGGHLNPHGRQHGTANPAGSHLGDLPNLVTDSYGAGTVTAKLRDGRAAVEAALFDADGTAIVVHADPDDNLTDPSGNSGIRIGLVVFVEQLDRPAENAAGRVDLLGSEIEAELSLRAGILALLGFAPIALALLIFAYRTVPAAEATRNERAGELG